MFHYLRYALSTLFFVVAMSAFAPANNPFTAAEQQQISIETPGLFARSNAFSIDFSILNDKEFSFPLPVGKAKLVNNAQLDITTNQGDVVKAMFSGTVRLSRKLDGYGNVVVVRHGNGLETVYGNNAQNLVKVGQSVKAGQTIAIVGADGKLTFAIMVNGGRINPETILGVKSHKLRRQTLLCKKGKGRYVDVSVVDGQAEEPDIADDAFADKAQLKLDLAGIVTLSGRHFGYGNCIRIKHRYGFETLYSHQSKNFVKVGQRVKAGEVIGLTGRTGRATTEHLHFEISFKGRRLNPAVIFDHVNKKLQQATLTLGKNGSLSSKKN